MPQEPTQEKTPLKKEIALLTCRQDEKNEGIIVLSVNEHARDICGFSPENLFPMSVQEFIRKAPPSYPWQIILSEQNFKRMPLSFEYSHAESGRYYSVMIISDPDSDRLLVTSRDITEEKSQELFQRTIVTSEYDFIGVADASGIITEVVTDRTGIVLLGGESYVGRTIEEVYGKEFAEPLMDLLHTVRDRHESSSIFYHSPLADDPRRYRITCSEHMRTGDIQFIFAVKDITTVSAFPSPLKDTLFLGYVTHSADHNILELSKRLCDITGKDSSLMSGESIMTLLPTFSIENGKESSLSTKTGNVLSVRCYTCNSYTSSGDECLITSLIDTGEIEKSQRLLERKISFENLLFDLTSFIFRSTEESLDSDIDRALRLLGEFSGADRSYVFLYREGETMDNTHEWVAEGITEEKENLQQLPKDIFPNLVKDLEGGKNRYFREVEKMDYNYAAEREILLAQSVKSIQFVPLLAREKNYGFMGFDAVRSNMEWTLEEQQLLRYFANNLAEVLARNEFTKELVELKLKAETLAIERETSNKDLSIFFAKVSHEIRNSINSVLGMTHMLLDTHLTDQQRRYSEVIRSSSTFLIDLVKDILDFSKISNSEIEFRETTFSLKSVITYAAEAFKQDAERKQLQITYNVDRRIPPLLLGDPVRIGQILNNLIGNAIKFTDEGSISIQAVCPVTKGEIYQVEISVSDTGIGIPQENIDKLFTPFYSTGTSGSQDLHSSGLGLPIVKSLAQSMDGTIRIESSLGNGSSFILDLPLKIAGSSAIPESLDATWEGARVAVVDSDIRMAQLSSQLLSSLSFHPDIITEKEDFDLFLRKVGEAGHPYALCFIDITMIHDRALEILRLCRSEGKHISHQIILTSVNAASFKGLDERYRLFDNRFTTPLDAETVIAQINATGEKLQRDTSFNYSTFSVLAPLHVLVVEDIEINQEILIYMLDQVGASSAVASSGFEAVNMVKKEHFDVILLDIIMPGIDGYETAKLIRGLDAQVPIIAVTANATFEEREKCILAGMDEYLAKPIQKEDLYGVLLQYIPSQTAEEGTPEGTSGERESVSIQGFNVNKGLALLDYNKDVYIRLIRKFYDGYNSFRTLYEEASARSEDRIRFVHSVKSIASSLGAEDLSQLATRLETILLSGSDHGLEETERAFLSSFSYALQAVEDSPYITRNVEKHTKEEMRLSEVISLLETMLKGCSIGDIQHVKQALKEIQGFELPQRTAQRIEEAEEFILAYNFLSAETIIQNLLDTLSGEGENS